MFALFIRRLYPDPHDWEPIVFYEKADPDRTLQGIYIDRRDAERARAELVLPANIEVKVDEFVEVPA